MKPTLAFLSVACLVAGSLTACATLTPSEGSEPIPNDMPTASFVDSTTAASPGVQFALSGSFDSSESASPKPSAGLTIATSFQDTETGEQNALKGIPIDSSSKRAYAANPPKATPVE
jgi:hypothetical protein